MSYDSDDDDDEDETVGPVETATVGGATGAAAVALIKSGPFDKLFGGVAEHYGQKLLESAQRVSAERAKRRELKRIERAAVHVKAVLSSPAGNKFETDFPHINDDDLIDEWMDGAGNVDPADKEISELWQALLLGLRGRDNSKLLLSSLRNIHSDDAIMFLSISGLSSNSLNYKVNALTVDNLRRADLVETRTMKFRPLLPLVVGLFAASAVFIFWIQLVLGGDSGSMFQLLRLQLIHDSSITVANLLTVLMVIIIVVIYWRLFDYIEKPSLTPLGKHLKSLAERLRGNPL